jgi:hypothetical protein
MRIQVEYDGTGRIIALAIPNDEGSNGTFMALMPREGNRVAFVEARHVASADDFEALLEIRRTHLVEEGEQFNRLVTRG